MRDIELDERSLFVRSLNNFSKKFIADEVHNFFDAETEIRDQENLLVTLMIVRYLYNFSKGFNANEASCKSWLNMLYSFNNMFLAMEMQQNSLSRKILLIKC